MASRAYKFNEAELEALRFALTYLHDADLSEFNMVKPLESVMDKLGVDYSKWIDEEGNNDGK